MLIEPLIFAGLFIPIWPIIYMQVPQAVLVMVGKKTLGKARHFPSVTPSLAVYVTRCGFVFTSLINVSLWAHQTRADYSPSTVNDVHARKAFFLPCLSQGMFCGMFSPKMAYTRRVQQKIRRLEMFRRWKWNFLFFLYNSLLNFFSCNYGFTRCVIDIISFVSATTAR